MNLETLIQIKDKDSSYNAKRLVSQILFASELSSHANNDAFSSVIDKAISLLCDAYKNSKCVSNALRSHIEKLFVPYIELAKAVKVHCVAHAHRNPL